MSARHCATLLCLLGAGSTLVCAGLRPNSARFFSLLLRPNQKLLQRRHREKSEKGEWPERAFLKKVKTAGDVRVGESVAGTRAQEISMLTD